MKYTINNNEFQFNFHQKTIPDVNLYQHKDIFDSKVSWYNNGYTPIKIPHDVLSNIRFKTLKYIQDCLTEFDLTLRIENLEKYHKIIQNDISHLNFLKKIGKCILPKTLGINTAFFSYIVQNECQKEMNLDSKNVCDIRLFRPYNDSFMDNNPIHRDTWLPIINNSIKIYIPIAGNNELSSLSLIPGSHPWEDNSLERTATNALINNVQYGLPAVTNINKEYQLIRPELDENEILLFSSHIVHGGALNLNKNTTRVSIEMRFWDNK